MSYLFRYMYMCMLILGCLNMGFHRMRMMSPSIYDVDLHQLVDYG